MNMANHSHEEELDIESRAEFLRRGEKSKTPRRRAQYARANRPAASHNGIHRRRNKRFSW